MKRKMKTRYFKIENINGKDFREFIERISHQFPNEQLIGYRAKPDGFGCVIKAEYCECLYKD